MGKKKEIDIAEKYSKAHKDLRWINPIYLILFDDLVEHMMPEITFEQRVKFLRINQALKKEFDQE